MLKPKLIFLLILCLGLLACSPQATLPTLVPMPSLEVAQATAMIAATQAPSLPSPEAISASATPVAETINTISVPATATNIAPTSRAEVANNSNLQRYEAQQIDTSSEPIQGTSVISFAPSASPAERRAYLQSIGASVNSEILSLDTVVVTVANPNDLPASTIVLSTEPDYYLAAQDDLVNVSNDEQLSQQWALPMLNVYAAWHDVTTSAPSVIVAVIDSGVCANHPDLRVRLLEGWDFVDDDANPEDLYGHGCAVAGIIAANTNNLIGIAGIAPNAQILPLRVLNDQGVGTYSDVAAAIIYAVDHGAAVINLSLGGTMPSATLQSAVDYASNHNVAIVAAAGNNGQPITLYPAAYASVIAVGSVNYLLERSSFSNYGSEVDIWAPGSDIISTSLNDSYAMFNGTSFAAPQVTGVWVLEHSMSRNLSANGGVVRYDAGNINPTATANPTQAADTSITVGGTLIVTIGDPDPSVSGLEHQDFTTLTDANGESYVLNLSLTDALPFHMQEVQVTGTYAQAVSEAQATTQLALDVTNIQRLQAAGLDGEVNAAAVTGSQPWLSVLCRFSDSTGVTPNPVSFYDELFTNIFPSSDHYWRQVSYNTIDIVGSDVVGWYNLPQPLSYYMNNGNPNLNAMAQHCAAVADPTVNFAPYVGINFIVNQSIGCCAWGGGLTLQIDGGSRFIRTTWLPPGWGVSYGVLWHEMGHGFGLPHSSGQYGEVYDSQWDVMSGGGTCAIYDNSHGCVSSGTISYHLDRLGWIATNRKYTVTRGTQATVTLERINSPLSSSSYLMASIPITTSPLRYFTVELRQQVNYDENIPSEGIIIHEVMSRSENAHVVDADNDGDTNDAGAVFVAGESHTDVSSNVTISVLSISGTTAIVQINNNATSADIGLTGIANADPVGAGNNLSYTLTANNPNGSSVSQLSLVANLPLGVSFVSATPQQGSCNHASGTVTCQLNTLAANSSRIVTIVVNVASSTIGDISLTADLTHGGVDPNTANNSVSISTTVVPGPPFLLSPANNAFTAVTTPELTWAAVTNADSYQVQIASNSNFSSILEDIDGWVSTTYSPNPLSDGLFYWRVRAITALQTGEWSSVRSFTVDTVAPVSPSLLTPSNGSTTESAQPQFTWSSSANLTYDFEIRISSSSNIITITGLTSASYTPITALLTREYAWRVRATDLAGNVGAWSSEFTVNIASPANATPMPNYFTTSTPNLVWAAVSWANLYEIQVDNNNSFTSPEYSNASISSSTTTILLSALPDGSYYWRLRARRADNVWGTWSITESFTISTE